MGGQSQGWSTSYAWWIVGRGCRDMLGVSSLGIQSLGMSLESEINARKGLLEGKTFDTHLH